MTQSQAFWKCVDLLGDGATAGYGVIGKRTDQVFFAGKKVKGEWINLGTSEKSFDEAIKNIKDVPR